MSNVRQGAVSNGGNGKPAWYAIRTRSRHEKLVNQQLAFRSVEAFLPLVDRRRRWKDRWKNVTFPLFPGYCFARFRSQDRVAVVTVVGVVQILGVNGRAIPVPDHEIDAVRQLVTSTLPFDPHPYLKEGMEVEVLRGPLAGLRGLLVRKESRARVVVAIHLIQQAASVELDAADVRGVG